MHSPNSRNSAMKIWNRAWEFKFGNGEFTYCWSADSSGPAVVCWPTGCCISTRLLLCGLWLCSPMWAYGNTHQLQCRRRHAVMPRRRAAAAAGVPSTTPWRQRTAGAASPAPIWRVTVCWGPIPVALARCCLLQSRVRTTEGTRRERESWMPVRRTPAFLGPICFFGLASMKWKICWVMGRATSTWAGKTKKSRGFLRHA